MNKQQLSEALAYLEREFGPTDNWPDGDPEWIEFAPLAVAARLVERLLPEECPDEECVNGWLDPPRILHEACHGSGRVWDEGIVEAVREAIRSPLVEVVSIELEPSQFETALDEMARAVLSALVELLTEKSPSELEWLAARGKGGGH